MIETTAVVVAALLLDLWLGEPRHWHPLVGFGRVASWIEGRLNHEGQPPLLANLRGMVAVVVPVALVTAAAWGVVQLPRFDIVAELLLLYLALGGASLAEHARAVAEPLQRGDIAFARREVAKLVSRDTSGLDRWRVARATVESVLENGNDALFGALFWYLVAGAPGAVAYRLVNTLDAMWGYKSPRYLHFGWFAARLDDILNLIPARLTALSYALLGNSRRAFACWFQQATSWSSPNAGPVMAAGAGALGVRLGGVASYYGVSHERPLLGEGREPEADDIDAALRLVRNSALLWVAVVAAGELLLA